MRLSGFLTLFQLGFLLSYKFDRRKGNPTQNVGIFLFHIFFNFLRVTKLYVRIRTHFCICSDTKKIDKDTKKKIQDAPGALFFSWYLITSAERSNEGLLF